MTQTKHAWVTTMKLLEQKIVTDGKHLGNGILKVDSFMNHQLDPNLMIEIGSEFSRHFTSSTAD
jgi:xanthine phosphoribosyltransferase